MDILPVNFTVLHLCGAWNEYEDNNIVVRLVHFSYRYTIVILIYHFMISEVIELTLTYDDVDGLTETLFMTLTFVALCCKFGNFLVRRKEILELLARFRADICQSQNSTEKDILDKYNNKAKWCALAFMTLSLNTGIAILLAPILAMHTADRILPLRVYVPYSIIELPLYTATYFQQSVALFYGILLNVSFDCLVYGFTLRTCGQIELLCHRLIEIFQDARVEDGNRMILNRHALIQKCVKHHILIYEFVSRIRALFVWVITILFIFSLITLCTSILLMTKKAPFSAEFLSFTLYLGSMLFQIFCYCWYGNELELKSKSIGDAVYSCDWTTATIRERRSLLIVMSISQKGLILSYYGIFALSLHTFTWILKTSYSVFNVLKQMSD